ncbi:hypothetical protein EDD53_1655 [Pacificibacter maritimus]|uniref:Uncharacterized protein n=1 Tax=Pacificibacter maritimus TaxID=762213 RepID=A0A3N4V063_9RHOB|nr:hypothetical protein [Pacificibacter maritimus]RPE67250.1 hypothetical protein EDD53_1655 [Pacificibacter maritimus]
MRTALLFTTLLMLPACQIGLPEIDSRPADDMRPVNIEADPNSVKDDDSAPSEQAATPTPEASLSAAFEQAASAANAPIEPKKTGLFARLRKSEPPQVSVLAGTGIEVIAGSDAAPARAALKAPDPADSDAADIDVAPQSETDIAQPTAPVSAAPSKAKKPLFGFLKSGSGEARVASKSTVALGQVLPFGEVGIACEVGQKDLGTQVDQSPSKGAARWQLFDTDPSSIAPRTQFITGFKDGCARQVTASLIMFGSPDLHEVHRYSKSQSKVSWSSADDAYEKIKSSACGVPRKTPCPVSKVDNLARDLAFVSVYRNFGDTTGWLELLLYNGSLTTKEMR